MMSVQCKSELAALTFYSWEGADTVRGERRKGDWKGNKQRRESNWEQRRSAAILTPWTRTDSEAGSAQCRRRKELEPIEINTDEVWNQSQQWHRWKSILQSIFQSDTKLSKEASLLTLPAFVFQQTLQAAMISTEPWRESGWGENGQWKEGGRAEPVPNWHSALAPY